MLVVALTALFIFWCKISPLEGGVTTRYRRDTDITNVEAVYSRFKTQIKGEATYYGTYPGGGACSLDPLSPLASQPGWIRVAAGHEDFQNSLGCGMCVEITGTGEGKGSNPVVGKLKGVVHDLCGGCGKGSVDLYIDGDGRWGVKFKAIDCPTVPGSDGNIMMRFTGSNLWYIKLQARNSKIPVAGIEVLKGDKYSCLRRVGDNYFVGDGLGKVDFPMQVRLTSVSGEQRETIINAMKNDEDLKTDIQFTGHASGGGPSTILCMGQGNKPPYPKGGVEPGSALPAPSPGARPAPAPSEPKPAPQPKPSSPKPGSGGNNFCKDRPGGTYADPEYCRAFIICNNKKVHRQFCPQDQMFNPKGMNCDLASRVDCGSRSLDYPAMEQSDVDYSDLKITGENQRPYSNDTNSQESLDTQETYGTKGSETLITQEKNSHSEQQQTETQSDRNPSASQGISTQQYGSKESAQREAYQSETHNTQERISHSDDLKQPQGEAQSERNPKDFKEVNIHAHTSESHDQAVTDREPAPSQAGSSQAEEFHGQATPSEIHNQEVNDREPAHSKAENFQSDVDKQVQAQNISPETYQANNRRPTEADNANQPEQSQQTHFEGGAKEGTEDSHIQNESSNQLQLQTDKQHQQLHSNYFNLHALQNAHLEARVTEKADHPIEYNAEGKPITKPSNDRPRIHVDDPLDYNKISNKSNDDPSAPSAHLLINGDQSIDTSSKLSHEAIKSRPSFEITVSNNGVDGHGLKGEQSDQPEASAQSDNGELHLHIDHSGLHARVGNSAKQQFMDDQGSQSSSGGFHLHVNNQGVHASLGNVNKQQQDSTSYSDSANNNEGFQLHLNKDGLHASLGGKGGHAEQQQQDVAGPSYSGDKNAFQFHFHKGGLHATMADEEGGQHEMDAQLASGSRAGVLLHMNKNGLHAHLGGENYDPNQQMDSQGASKNEEGFHLRLSNNGLQASMNRMTKHEQYMDQASQSDNRAQGSFDGRNDRQYSNADFELTINRNKDQRNHHDEYDKQALPTEYDDHYQRHSNENEQTRQDPAQEASNDYNQRYSNESEQAYSDPAREQQHMHVETEPKPSATINEVPTYVDGKTAEPTTANVDIHDQGNKHENEQPHQPTVTESTASHHSSTDAGEEAIQDHRPAATSIDPTASHVDSTNTTENENVQEHRTESTDTESTASQHYSTTSADNENMQEHQHESTATDPIAAHIGSSNNAGEKATQEHQPEATVIEPTTSNVVNTNHEGEEALQDHRLVATATDPMAAHVGTTNNAGGEAMQEHRTEATVTDPTSHHLSTNTAEEENAPEHRPWVTATESVTSHHSSTSNAEENNVHEHRPDAAATDAMPHHLSTNTAVEENVQEHQPWDTATESAASHHSSTNNADDENLQEHRPMSTTTASHAVSSNDAGTLFSTQQSSQTASLQHEGTYASSEQSPAAAHVAATLVEHEKDIGESHAVFHHPLEALTAFQNHQQMMKERNEEKSHSEMQNEEPMTNSQEVIIKTKEETNSDQKEKGTLADQRVPVTEEIKTSNQDVVVTSKEDDKKPEERPTENDQNQPGVLHDQEIKVLDADRNANKKIQEESSQHGHSNELNQIHDNKPNDQDLETPQKIQSPQVETMETTVVEKLPENGPEHGMTFGQGIRPTFEDQPKVEEISPVDQSVSDLQVYDGAMPHPTVDIYLSGSRDGTTVLRMGNNKNEIASRRDSTSSGRRRRPIVGITIKHKGSPDQHIEFSKRHKLSHHKRHHRHHRHLHHHKKHHHA